MNNYNKKFNKIFRYGFPIKINGFALGSQDNLNQADDQPRFKLHSRSDILRLRIKYKPKVKGFTVL